LSERNKNLLTLHREMRPEMVEPNLATTITIDRDAADATRSAQVPATEQNAVCRNWWHDDPPDAQRYSGGRLAGTIKQLAYAVGVDPKTLKTMNRFGAVWIQRVHGRLWAMSFSSGTEYTRAHARLRSINEEKQ
jgi:hypothetical protein